MSYRGYHLEQKTLMVGWQITITMGDKFVRNGTVTKDLSAAMAEAKQFVDHAIAEVDAVTSSATS